MSSCFPLARETHELCCFLFSFSSDWSQSCISTTSAAQGKKKGSRRDCLGCTEGWLVAGQFRCQIYKGGVEFQAELEYLGVSARRAGLWEIVPFRSLTASLLCFFVSLCICWLKLKGAFPIPLPWILITVHCDVEWRCDIDQAKGLLFVCLSEAELCKVSWVLCFGLVCVDGYRESSCLVVLPGKKLLLKIFFSPSPSLPPFLGHNVQRSVSSLTIFGVTESLAGMGRPEVFQERRIPGKGASEQRALSLIGEVTCPAF